MRTTRKYGKLAAAFLALLPIASPLRAGEHSGTVQSTRLYTAPDSNANGGIRATLVLPNEPLLDVFAMPIADYQKVYKGHVSTGGKAFQFTGLPVGKYDLLLLYEDGFYEGFTLSRESDALTPGDRESIKQAIGRAVPFFDTKEVHRAAGTPGQEGKARCVLQELRTRLILNQNGDELKGYQIRSLKLALMQDVGKGWQMVETRELVRTEVAPAMRKGLLPHHYHPTLGGIRVTDETKDLGAVNLDQERQ